ncbi:hypothetical protein DO021_12500 [Desulfobacter hydrogenophilus]|uniref:Uncharacterized protein n=1 Tax=Desulfobacter hydrogenophilus TaxID=2291 RepID=A0A328FBC2_9BACT|nr:hypothetical protein DO021_12500 [Desulfobacter hydrogenophilus]
MKCSYPILFFLRERKDGIYAYRKDVSKERRATWPMSIFGKNRVTKSDFLQDHQGWVQQKFFFKPGKVSKQ